MFIELTSFAPKQRRKRAPMLADFLRFNAKQSRHYCVGSAGEKLAQAIFEDSGFKAYKPESYHGVDLKVVDRHTGEIFSVEVKTATLSECRKSWQFCLNKPKCCNASNSDYVLLICIAESGYFTYLMPSSFFAGTKQFTISSHPEKYRGKAAAYRQRGQLSFAAAADIYQLAMLQ